MNIFVSLVYKSDYRYILDSYATGYVIYVNNKKKNYIPLSLCNDEKTQL